MLFRSGASAPVLNYSTLAEDLASRGYVVLSVNYRLGIGYGHDFHRPPNAGAHLRFVCVLFMQLQNGQGFGRRHVWIVCQ